MNRLNNAVKQRNAAREEALLASEKLKKLEEDLEAGRLQMASPAPSQAGMPTADGSGTPDEPGGAQPSLHAADMPVDTWCIKACTA